MGQKVNPNGLRIGINKEWNSRWYADKKNFSKYLGLDLKIRKYLDNKLADAMLSHVTIERIKDLVNVSVFVARPGVVIGQEGANVKKIKEDLVKLTGLKDDKLKFTVVEIKNADLDATLVAKSIAKQLEERASFRIVQKKAIKNVLAAGAKGCKTMVKGRVGGAEIARTEQYREGTLSLQTLSQNIDYGFAEAKTTYGRLGVKVWISLPDNFTSNVVVPGDKRPSRDNKNFNGKNGRRANNKNQNRRPAPAPTPTDANKKGE